MEGEEEITLISNFNSRHADFLDFGHKNCDDKFNLRNGDKFSKGASRLISTKGTRREK